MSRTSCLAAALLMGFVWVTTPQAAAFESNVTAAPALSLDTAAVGRALLRAAGVNEVDIHSRGAAIESAVHDAVARMGSGPPNFRRARKLHRLMYREYFKNYVSTAGSLEDILARGDYNCLSATMLYALVARELGFEPRVLALPGHVMLRLRVGGHDLDVETTSPDGFDARRHVSCEPGPRTCTSGDARLLARDDYWVVSLDQAIGLAWVDRAWKAFDGGEALPAAEAVAEAGRYLQDLARQAESARRLLAQAFSMDYERGRFDTAFRIAAVEVGLFPDRTTSRDRLLAATLKRVEAALTVDEPLIAGEIMDQVSLLSTSSMDLSRLERRVWPLISVAAVRTEDWGLAERAVRRYAAVEPDGVEVVRLARWVEVRSQGDPLFAVDEICSEVLLGARFPLNLR